jgi:hypothetical protein
MRKIILLFVSIVVLVWFDSALASSTGKITARIIDEDGIPIQGAEAKITFKFAKQGGIGLNTKAIQGNTNKEGFFTAQGKGMASISVSATKDGFYKSGRGYEFTSRSLLNRWEPWNPTVEVVLKKKRNLVAMYRKYLEAANIPVMGSPAGYDFEKGDWVSPHGKGVVSDLIFVCQNKYVDFSNAETSCEISFSNPQDGLQEYKFEQEDQSYYKWPFEAPEKGYNIKKLSKWMSVHLSAEGYDYESNFRENINYLFRVRTEVDKEGNIIKANYGKIKGDIQVYKKGQVNLTYSFNPDGTRNLEEDPDRNLFKNK